MMLKRITPVFHLLWKSEGIRQSILVSGGSLFGSGISAIAILAISRWLGPDEFGKFSSLWALSTIISRMGDVGLNMAIQRRLSQVKDRGEVETSRVASTGARMKLVAGAAVLGLTMITGPWIATFLGMELLWIYLAIALAIPTLLYEFFLMTFQGLHRFSMASIMQVLQGIIKLIGVLILRQIGMFETLVVFSFYTVAPLFACLDWKYWKVNWKPYDRKVQQNLRSVAAWMGVAVISATVADNIDILIVKGFLTSYETGLFSAASRITMFVQLGIISVMGVLSVRVARYKQLHHLRMFIKKSLATGIGFGILSVLLGLVARPALLYSSGTEYLEATYLLQVLLFSTGLAGVTASMAALFYLFEKPRYYAYSGLLLTITLLVGDWLFISSMGLIGAAWARVVARLFVLVFTAWYAWGAYGEYVRSLRNK